MENKLADKILTSSEKLWLETVYSKLKAGEVFNEGKLRVELSEELSKRFDTQSIDSRLLRDSLNLTLLGTALINPKSYLVGKADKIIQTVRQIISKPDFDTNKINDITSQEISKMSKVSESDVEYILGMLAEIGFYHSFGMAFEGKYFNSIKIDKEAFRNYLDNKNISECLIETVEDIREQQWSERLSTKQLNSIENDLRVSKTTDANFLNPMENQIDKRKVFVVHGRNYQIRDAMFNFLRSISLEPIEWSEAIAMTKQGSPYVGDVLEVAFNTAQAIVILMTPDDEARLLEQYRGDREPDYETQLTPQPRPNVILEAGMALGKNPDRTVLVEIGEMRPISDITGRHTVRLNNSVSKRQDIIDRLETAGCDVNIKGKRDWHTVGNFDIPLVSKSDTKPESIQKNSQIEKLSEEPIKILTLLSELSQDSEGADSSFISEKTQIPASKAIYLLDKLADMDFVTYYGDMDLGTLYHITKSGRRYLFEEIQ